MINSQNTNFCIFSGTCNFQLLTTSSKSFQFVFILLLLTAKCKRFLNKLPAHRALLKILHTAITQARVSTRQEHPVHSPILANNTVFAILLWRVYFTFRESGLFQQTLVCALFFWRGIVGGSGVIICGHEKLLQIKETSLKIITNDNYPWNLGS